MIFYTRKDFHISMNRKISLFLHTIAVTLVQLSFSCYSVESSWATVVSVNSYFNLNYDVKDDITLWNVDDFWATPLEFKSKGAGDCEDFAIAKYFRLLELGVPRSSLALSYVTLNESLSHMVLIYKDSEEKTWFVLDNYNPELLPVSKRPDLHFIYSFNEEGVWVPDKGRVIGKLVSQIETIGKWRELLQKIK